MKILHSHFYSLEYLKHFIIWQFYGKAKKNLGNRKPAMIFRELLFFSGKILGFTGI
jgi:hypothetical protein